MRIIILVLVLALLLGQASCHFDTSSSTWTTEYGQLKIIDPAIRFTERNTSSMSGYVVIKNEGDETEQLVSASCVCADSVTLKAVNDKSDTSNISSQTTGFEIRPGQTLVFSPTGNHILLEGVNITPKEGDIVTLDLKFRNAGTVPTITRVLGSKPVKFVSPQPID